MQENTNKKVDLNVEDLPENIFVDKEINSEAENTQVENNMESAQVEELQNSILRLKADFDNYKRRTQAEREQFSIFVTAEVVNKILPVLDSFKRAQASLPATVEESVRTGLDNILKQFEQAFANIGVEKISTTEKFNPELHEAMMRGENSELETGSIEMVFEEGYVYKGKVVRHSKVKVVG